jgi:hypothetical protein
MKNNVYFIKIGPFKPKKDTAVFVKESHVDSRNLIEDIPI